MKLYLHIGTEKTGSSYLQSMAAMNRKSLELDGIWFPTAGKRESQLQQGQISAGNAQPLTDALRTGESKGAKNLLQYHLQVAIKRKCHSVLLSNELLVLALAKSDHFKTLEDIAMEVGYTNILCLLILRDPVEQAFSLYKHRAKSGTAPRIEEWPREHYFYGEGLYNFLNTVQERKVDFTCRKYSQRPGYLEQIFFVDWLKCKYDLIKPSKTVNPSLSISELVLINKLWKRDRLLPKFLYERLLVIPKNEKAQEPRISAYYRSVLANSLAKHVNTWILCNQYLPVGEALELPKSTSEDLSQDEKIITFSEKQAEVLSAFIREVNSSRFQWKLFTNTWRRQFGIVKNKWLVKKR